MLQGFSRSIPFLLIRTVLVLAEGATLYFGSVYVQAWFELFISGYVDGFFLTVVSPMGYIIGLALGALVVKYVLGLIQYYFKLAHIIFLTTLILQYKPFKGSRFFYSLIEATVNFASLALNDFTTRTVVKALGALKDAILSTDLLSKFRDPKLLIVKFVKNICVTGLTNVINMTDEIIVSYTWFTNDLYLAERARQGQGAPNVKDKIKNKALFMLEGMVFTVRVLPQLLINSLLFEVAFILLANIATIAIIISLAGYIGFSFFFFVCAFILYRTLIRLFYYVVIESLRLTVYLHSFYSEVNELEPFNINDTLAELLGKIPLLGPLVQNSGQEIEPSSSGASNILEGDLNQMIRDNVTQVASSFNLNPSEIIVEDRTQVIVDDSVDVEDEFALSEEVASGVVENEEQTSTEDIVVEESPIPTEDIEVEVTTPSSPFNESNRINNQGR